MSSTVLDRPADAPAPSTPRPAAQPARRRLPPEVYALALLALVGYAAAGVWLRYGLDFSVGDAVARTAEAKYMVLSRDPHAAALGFYWMPIPTVVQLPLVLLLDPFGQAELAGPVSTAMFGAGTVLVLGRLAAELHLPRLTAGLLLVAYAANPVVVYVSANGMGEAALFFFVALTLSGVLSYTGAPSSRALLLAAFGLAGTVLARYEAVPLLAVVPALLALVDARRGSWARARTTLVLAGAPAAWGLALWVLYMRVIGGSFTAFRTGAETTTGTGPGAEPAYQPEYLAGAGGGVAEALAWTGSWLLAFGPALLLLVPALLPLRRRSLGTLAVLLTAAALPAVVVVLLVRRATTGEPRYFVSFVLLAAVAALWTAGRLREWSLPGRRVVTVVSTPLLAGLLVLGAVTGSNALTDVDRTHYNSESRVFERVLGQPVTPVDGGAELPRWRTFTRLLDATVPDGRTVLVDTRYAFPAAVLSRRTRQFVMSSDRDYESQVSPTGLQRFDYVAVVDGGLRQGLAGAFDEGGAVVRRAPDAWQEVFTVPGAASLYRRAVPSGPDGVPQLDPA